MDMIRRFSMYGFLKNLRFFEPFFILFFMEKGLSFTAIGFLVSIREICVNILEIPSGIAADMISKKKAMLVSFGSYIVSFVIMHFGANFWHYSLAMIFFGCGEAFRSGTHKAIIMDWLECQGRQGEKHAVYSLTRSWSMLGSAASAVIAALLVFYRGSYQSVFIASTVPYVGGFLLISTYPDKFCSIKKEVNTHITELWTQLNQYSIKNALISSSFFEAGFRSVKDHFQPLAASFIPGIVILGSLSEEQSSSVIMGVFYLIVFLICSWCARKSKDMSTRLGSLNTGINAGMVALGLCVLFAGLTLGNQAWGLFACCIMFIVSYMIYNLRKPMMVAFLGDAVEKEHRASVLSVDNQVRAVFIMLLSPVLGFFCDFLGIGPGIALFGLLLLCAAPFAWIGKMKGDKVYKTMGALVIAVTAAWFGSIQFIHTFETADQPLDIPEFVYKEDQISDAHSLINDLITGSTTRLAFDRNRLNLPLYYGKRKNLLNFPVYSYPFPDRFTFTISRDWLRFEFYRKTWFGKFQNAVIMAVPEKGIWRIYLNFGSLSREFTATDQTLSDLLLSMLLGKCVSMPVNKVVLKDYQLIIKR